MECPPITNNNDHAAKRAPRGGKQEKGRATTQPQPQMSFGVVDERKQALEKGGTGTRTRTGGVKCAKCDGCDGCDYDCFFCWGGREEGGVWWIKKEKIAREKQELREKRESEVKGVWCVCER